MRRRHGYRQIVIIVTQRNHAEGRANRVPGKALRGFGERIAEASDAGESGRTIWSVRHPDRTRRFVTTVERGLHRRHRQIRGRTVPRESIGVGARGRDRIAGKASGRQSSEMNQDERRVRFRTEKGTASWMVKKTSLVLESKTLIASCVCFYHPFRLSSTRLLAIFNSLAARTRAIAKLSRCYKTGFPASDSRSRPRSGPT